MTTQELTKEVVDMKSRQAGMEEKMTDACARLVVVEHEVKEQGKLLQSIDRLTIGISSLQEKIKEMGTKIDVFGGRLDVIELKPARRWETVTMDIIKLLVAVGVGYLLSQIGIS
jgi:hypothetical protein